MSGSLRCDWAGCSSLAISTPVVRVWASRVKDHEPIELDFALPTCLDCRANVGLGDLMTPYGRATIDSNLDQLGAARPDWDTAELVWKDVPGGKA